MKTFFMESEVYPWSYNEKVFFRGYFFAENKYYSGLEAIEYLLREYTHRFNGEVLRQLNGIFNVIWERENDIIIAVDRVRGLPLFYTIVDNELYVGNDVKLLAKGMKKREISVASENEMKATDSFVLGDKTLLEGLFQVEASTYVRYDKLVRKLEKVGYFRVIHENFYEKEKLEKNFFSAYKKAANNFVQALQGRMAVVPLSGGADSRMVLEMLKMENYQNVFCFTYGSEGCNEAKISKLVAESYNYQWMMVPYTKEMYAEIRKDEEFQRYLEMAFSYVSTPHIQDYLAVKYLKKQGIIPKNSVFVPGHTGVMPGGGMIPESLKKDLSNEQVLELVEKTFFCSCKVLPTVKKELEERFLRCDLSDVEGVTSEIEWFNIQERQAKFIINSVRIYEQFGYHWLLPLCDNDIFEFWRHVPVELRFHKKLYRKMMNSNIKSTNDESALKSIAAIIRKTPGIRWFVRKGKRIINWWTSPLQLERAFSFTDYIMACLKGNQFFEINTLLCRKILSTWKDKLKNEEK